MSDGLRPVLCGGLFMWGGLNVVSAAVVSAAPGGRLSEARPFANPKLTTYAAARIQLANLRHSAYHELVRCPNRT
jgi:hypothetical protein